MPDALAVDGAPAEAVRRDASGQLWLRLAPGSHTIVLSGTLHVEHEGGSMDVAAGQAVIAHRGEWVRYSTPGTDGAEYIAVCVPAFSPDTVHRD